MITDPKQIVTPYAFSVHPDLLGLPLASPKRRLAALLIDLLIASILTSLGNTFLAFAVTIIVFWVAIRTRGESKFKNFLRYTGATIASIFVFAISFAIIESFDLGESESVPETVVTMNGNEDIDWAEFGSRMATMDYSNPDAIEEGFEQFVKDFGFEDSTSDDASFLTKIDSEFTQKLTDFRTAIEDNDTLEVDKLRNELASIIASYEINQQENKIDKLSGNVDELTEKNEELTEQIENPSLYATLKRTAKMLGLSIGWIGIYFIATIAYFRGQTLGKRLLKIRVIRLNNKPIGLFFAFERFGGYAAGFATGLIGFFQMFWDANRQAIHDKIAGTVVIDLRESKMEATNDLRNEILERENLLLQMPEL